MKLINYIAGLLPSLGKNDILDDLEVLSKEIRESTLPVYSTALETLLANGTVSPESEAFEGLMGRKFPDVKVHYIKHTYNTLKRVDDFVPVLRSLVEKSMASKTTRDAMTHLRGQILHYVEAATLVTRYARRNLHYIVICEAAASKGRKRSRGEGMSEAQVTWLNDNRVAFLDACFSLNRDKKESTKAFKAIPDVVVRDDGVAEANIGPRVLDPFKLGFIPPQFNIVYQVGIRVAEYQAARLKSAKEEAKVLEYRLLELRQSADGVKDAKLQQLIEYTEDRVQKLNYKISKQEEEYTDV